MLAAVLRFFFNSVLKHFLRGLPLVLPFFLTLYFLYYAFFTLNSTVTSVLMHLPWLEKIVKDTPGISLLITSIFITAVGYSARLLFFRLFLDSLEALFMQIPLVNVVFSYIRESTVAFVDKIGQPVLVTIHPELGIRKVGFITSRYPSCLALEPDQVAVYLPHSYAFSGEMSIVSKKHIEPLNLSGSEALRIVLSGGLAQIKKNGIAAPTKAIEPSQ